MRGRFDLNEIGRIRHKLVSVNDVYISCRVCDDRIRSQRASKIMNCVNFFFFHFPFFISSFELLNMLNEQAFLVLFKNKNLLFFLIVD